MKLVKKHLGLLLLLAFACGQAWATSGGSGGLPWEGPLNTIARSLTGPVALGISIIALMVAGGTLVFGGELSEFARRAVLAVLAISFLVAGTSFMSILFGVSGAVVTGASGALVLVPMVG